MQPELEHIQPCDHASLVWRRFHCDGFPFLWHFHPEMELTLINAGHGQRFVGDSIETFAPGDLVLLGANLPHTWHSQPPAVGAPAAESTLIQFPQDFAGSDLWHRPEADGVRRLLERARQGLHFPPNHAGVADLLLSMSDQTGWTRVVTALNILGLLAQTPDAGRPLSGIAHTLPPRRDDQQRIDIVCRLIAHRYAEGLGQAEAAAAIHLSPSSFSRFFKRMTGRTFVAYVHELRIADACRRLHDSEPSITDICFECGFDNVSNFNRVFRKLRLMSPREYRKRLKAAAASHD